ncbi:AAA family ATPase [Neorhizobium petrolearium]
MPDLRCYHPSPTGRPFQCTSFQDYRLASPGLDTILGGGLVEGASYIVQGHPGAGKTIFSNQVAFANLSRGGKVLYVTLLAETHERLFQALGTLDFFDRAQLGTSISYVSVFQTLRDEGLSAVVSLIRQEIARQGATLLVFDGLLNARDRADTNLDVKTFVAEVQSQAAFVGCTVLFLTSTRIAEGSPEHTMVDGVIELHNELVGVRSVRRLQVKKSRGSAGLGGYHQFEITTAGLAAYPRMEAILSTATVEDQPGSAQIATGTTGFDALFGGGLPESSVTLVFGPSGCGKTSLGINFLSQASEEERALHFGFYETPARLLKKARALGVDLDTPLKSGALDVIWNPMTENLLDKLGHRLLDAVRSRGVKRLLIDGLGGFERAAIYPPRLVEFFAALTNEIRALGVTTIATWELRDLFGPTVTAPGPEISSLLDNLVMLRQVEISSRYKRTISVLKVRDKEFEPVIHELGFGSNGLSVIAPLVPVTGATTGVASLVGAEARA